MDNDSEFSIEYQFTTLPDAEERLAQAFDLILVLILEDLKSEQQPEPENETC